MAVTAYLDAVNAHKQARAEVERLTTIVNQVGNLMKSSPTTPPFTDIKNASPTGRFAADHWPTAEQITKAVYAMNEAANAVKEAYKMVPEHYRSGLISYSA